MKQRQHLGVSTHPRVCGFASEYIYKGPYVNFLDTVKIRKDFEDSSQFEVQHREKYK